MPQMPNLYSTGYIWMLTIKIFTLYHSKLCVLPIECYAERKQFQIVANRIIGTNKAPTADVAHAFTLLAYAFSSRFLWALHPERRKTIVSRLDDWAQQPMINWRFNTALHFDFMLLSVTAKARYI